MMKFNAVLLLIVAFTGCVSSEGGKCTTSKDGLEYSCQIFKKKISLSKKEAVQ